MSKNSDRLALIGGGKIGEAFISGLLGQKFLKPDCITVTTAHSETARGLATRLKIAATNDNRKAVAGASVIVLATKPKQVPAVCREIADSLAPGAVLISLATGVPTALIESFLRPKQPVVRAMPNTPIAIGKGMTVLCRGAYVKEQQLAQAKSMFSTVGEVAIVDEELMNACTGMSASGPAYVYVIIESLAEAGVKVGLPRELATKLAAQAVLGASAMVLESGMHPALLKDSVTTPSGVTIDGLMELEEGGLRVTLIKAIVMSTRRAGEIQDKLLEGFGEKVPGARSRG